MTIKDFLGLSAQEQFLEAKKYFSEIEDLSWNTAKRLQGECAVERFDVALDKVGAIASENYPIWYTWVQWSWKLHRAQPIHYIAACMVTKGALK